MDPALRPGHCGYLGTNTPVNPQLRGHCPNSYRFQIQEGSELNWLRGDGQETSDWDVLAIKMQGGDVLMLIC